MPVDYTLLTKVVLLTMLAGMLIYLLVALFRQLRAYRAEAAASVLRIATFEEQIRYQQLKAAQLEGRTQNLWAGTRKFRLDEIVAEADDVSSFYLIPHDGKPLPSFDPGQYLTFKLNVPDQPRQVTRCYSLSESPLRRDRYRVTIKKLRPPPDNPHASGGISSSYFHDALKVGDILDCTAPAGKFYLDMAEHTPIVLIGGGIGITPMLSMLYSIALSGAKRETWLFYGATHMREMVHAAHLRQLDKDNENIHVRYCLTVPNPGERAGIDYDHQGFVTVELIHSLLPATNYDYYVCGPAPMMHTITRDLCDAGVAESHIHFESFGPASVKKPLAAAGTDGGPSHAVRFAKSGKEFSWRQQHGSLLEFAESNGIEIDSGCRTGSCGTCAVALRRGTVEYLSQVDVDLESGSCLTCMAIPNESIEIDA